MSSRIQFYFWLLMSAFSIPALVTAIRSLSGTPTPSLFEEEGEMMLEGDEHHPIISLDGEALG